MADLSKSILESLERGLNRARQLADSGKSHAAADAFEKCADLAQRYANYAVVPRERARRLKDAKNYRQRAATLRNGSTEGGAAARATVVAGAGGAIGTATQSATAETEDEYLNAAVGLIQKAKVAWDDIAGLQDVKDKIRVAYGLALAARPDNVKVDPTCNILFYGPPGTGKTLLAAAASRELDATFFNVKTSNVLSKYFGESTKLIEALYRAARDKAPAVIFFDEFDALSGSRDSGDSSGTERRLLATLLAELDGLAEKGGGGPMIFTFAATNLPWAIDPAILSRFNRRVYVPLPDPQVRRKIMELNLVERGYQLAANLDELVGKTEGLSGRRVAQVCEAAVQKMIHAMNPTLIEQVDAGRDAVRKYQLKLRSLKIDDFFEALAGAGPELTPEQARRYQQWHQEQG